MLRFLCLIGRARKVPAAASYRGGVGAQRSQRSKNAPSRRLHHPDGRTVKSGASKSSTIRCNRTALRLAGLIGAIMHLARS